MPRPLVLALAAGCTAAAAAAGALATVVTVQASHQQARDDDRAHALAAGRQLAVDFGSYNYKTLKTDFDRVGAESTGTFRTTFLNQAAGVQDLILKVKAVSQSQVASAGVASISSKSATIIVALNRTITNTSVPKGQTDSFGLQISLSHQHGAWLATDVKPL